MYNSFELHVVVFCLAVWMMGWTGIKIELRFSAYKPQIYLTYLASPLDFGIMRINCTDDYMCIIFKTRKLILTITLIRPL